MSYAVKALNKFLAVAVIFGLLAAACGPRGAANQGQSGAPDDKSALHVQVVGLLEAIGDDTATVGGTRLTINANTEIAAGLQPNQQVEAQTVLAANGLAALAIRPAAANRASGQTFELTGVIENRSGNAWVIGGHTVRVASGTDLTGSPTVGGLAKVQGSTNAAGELMASEILGLSAAGDEIEFSGVVTSIGASQWEIGPNTVLVTPATEIKPGVALGVFVKVHALPQSDGSLLAREIEPEVEPPANGTPGPEDEQEFTGELTAIEGDLWTIGGQPVRVTNATEIEGDPQIGDIVKVHAAPGADGVLVAREIEPADGDDDGEDNDNGGPGDEQEFTGVLTAVNGDVWTIGGQLVRVTNATEIEGDPQIGDIVKVHAAPGADGVLVAREIEPADGNDDGEDNDDDGDNDDSDDGASGDDDGDNDDSDDGASGDDDGDDDDSDDGDTGDDDGDNDDGDDGASGDGDDD